MRAYLRTVAGFALLGFFNLGGCERGGGDEGGGDDGGGVGCCPTPSAPPAAGTVDSTFGTAAKAWVMTKFGLGDDMAYAVAIQTDQRIVAAGNSHNGSDQDFAVARYNSNGSLDTSFAAGGKVTTAIGSGDDGILGLALQSDGKIVAAGYTVSGSDTDFAVVRYNTNGTLDATFGTDGRVVTSDQDLHAARAVAIQADGKIVVGGEAIPSAGGSNEFAVVRYNIDGSLDSSFDADGVVKVASGPYPPDRCTALAIQADQKIVGAGRAVILSPDTDPCVVRLNADGSLDTSFDGDGILIFDFSDLSTSDEAHGIGFTSGGGVVVGGGVIPSVPYADFAAARCTSAGVVDAGFGADGKVTTEIGSQDEVAFALAVQTNDKIVLAGFYDNVQDDDFALVRYNTDGSLDTSFDKDGKLVLHFGSGQERARAVKLQSDGKIVAAGYAWNGTDYDFLLVRIWP